MIGHQTQVTVDGELVLTLADLWPERCKAVIVGVNPAPRSVAAGHYYQGSAGRRAMSRLRAAGMLPPDGGGFADDESVAAEIGFTDVVKRPTRRATDLTGRELEDGRAQLRAELEVRRVPLIVCVFKPAAEALLDRAAAPGFQPSDFAGSRVFRLPGPYAPSAETQGVMAQLAEYLDGGR